MAARLRVVALEVVWRTSTGVVVISLVVVVISLVVATVLAEVGVGLIVVSLKTFKSMNSCCV